MSEALRKMLQEAGLPLESSWTTIVAATGPAEADGEIDAGRKKLRSIMRSLPLPWILKLCRAAHATFPASAVAFAEYARVVGESLAWEQSLALWQEFLTRFPYYSGAYTEIATVLRHLGNIFDAERALATGRERGCAAADLVRQHTLLRYAAEQARCWQEALAGNVRVAIPMCKAVLAARNGDKQSTAALIQPLLYLLGLTTPSPQKDLVAAEKPESIIFIGGYGWSGSTAVTDLLKECSCVFDPLPVVGEFYAFENAFGIREFEKICQLSSDTDVFTQDHSRMVYEKLLDFYFGHVLGFVAPEIYRQKEAGCDGYHRQNTALSVVYSSAELNRKIGKIVSKYFGDIFTFVADAQQQQRYVREVMAYICTALSEMALVAISAGKSDITKYLLIDNAIHPANIRLLSYIPGKVSYLAVRRDVRDQCLSWRREPWRMGVYSSLQSMVEYIDASYQSMLRVMDQEFAHVEGADIAFSDFVTKESVQKEVLRWLEIPEGSHDRPATLFFPKKSAQRIGFYQDNLDREPLAFLERAMKGVLAGYATNPVRFTDKSRKRLTT